MNREAILSLWRGVHEHRQKVYAFLFLLWIPALAGSISIVAAQPEVVRVWHEIISTPEILEILELLMYAGWPVAFIAALTTAMILTDRLYDRVLQLQQSSTYW